MMTFARSVPPPRSIYRKLRSVLEVARRVKARSIDGLADRVASAGDAEFTRYGRDGGKVQLVACSEATIRRAVDMARELDLVSDDGSITAVGIQALENNDAFDRLLGEAVVSRLLELGIGIEVIEQLIRSGLARPKPSTLPTLDNLVVGLPTVAPASVLRQYLQLLAATGTLPTTRKKLFVSTFRR